MAAKTGVAFDIDGGDRPKVVRIEGGAEQGDAVRVETHRGNFYHCEVVHAVDAEDFLYLVQWKYLKMPNGVFFNDRRGYVTFDAMAAVEISADELCAAAEGV